VNRDAQRKLVKFCTIDTKTYVCLLCPILLWYVLKKCWCQLPEDGETIAPEHVGAM